MSGKAWVAPRRGGYSAASSATWRCVATACGGERHPYGSWEGAQYAMKRHAREVEHDKRWPLTITLHDGNGRQFAVTYVEAAR
jgi:hypothetical protein